ncbi:MAG TPA: class I SAM-dependent methyltransferase [Vicinamibacterales bacterium]|nr:class I SAM-dependent methyltransferase [Vicinamibacterales bacterium]
MGLFDRLAPRKTEPDAHPLAASAVVDDAVFATKALRKFLSCLTARESPVLLDLGPVVGSNVSFFGEQLGCKIFVEDIFADIDRHVRDGKLEDLPAFLKKRFTINDGTVDGILCWDVVDYLDRPAAQELATQLTRVLRPDGALLCFFVAATTKSDARYTKFMVVDEVNLKHRSYPALRARQAALLNRDIIRMFAGLRVSDSFLLQNNLREVLFRKPA